MELINIMNYMQHNGIDFEVEKATTAYYTNLLINIECGEMEIILNQKGKFDVYFEDASCDFDYKFLNVLEADVLRYIKNRFIN